MRKTINFADDTVVAPRTRPEGDVDPLATLRAAKWVRDETLLIFDASVMAYRAYHTRDLSASDGRGTSVLHGMLQMVRSTCDAANTRRWLLVWDGGVEYRRALWKHYKSRHDRQRTPEEEAERADMKAQIRLARVTFDSLNAASLSDRDIEADDLIGIAAGVAMRAIRNGNNPTLRRVCVVSDDKDVYQLIEPEHEYTSETGRNTTWNGGCVVWRGTSGKLVTDTSFREEFGFGPDLYPHYKALVGEPATGDNIPGVDKVGDVTAAKLVGAHGPVTAIVRAALDAIKAPKCPAVMQSIAKSRNAIDISYALSRIARRPKDLLSWDAPDALLAKAARKPHGGYGKYFTDDDVEKVRAATIAAVKHACVRARPCPIDAVRKIRSELGFASTFDRVMWETVCGFDVK